MNAKKINNDQFKEAIRVSFNGDNDIYIMYNPNVKVENVDDIVKDISTRIHSDILGATIKGVYEKDKLIGYYVFDFPHKALISFGLCKEYRKRKYLSRFWELIRSDLRGMFQCFLWTRNQRGIRWLQKNDMKIIATDNLVTHLIY